MTKPAPLRVLIILALAALAAYVVHLKMEDWQRANPEVMIFHPLKELSIDLAVTGCSVEDYGTFMKTKAHLFQDRTIRRRTVMGYRLRVPSHYMRGDVSESNKCPRCEDLGVSYWWPSYDGWLDYSKKHDPFEPHVWVDINNHTLEWGTADMKTFNTHALGASQGCEMVENPELGMLGCKSRTNHSPSYHVPLDRHIRTPTGLSVPVIECRLAKPEHEACWMTFGVTKDGLAVKVQFKAGMWRDWKRIYCESLAMLKVMAEK